MTQQTTTHTITVWEEPLPDGSHAYSVVVSERFPDGISRMSFDCVDRKASFSMAESMADLLDKHTLATVAVRYSFCADRGQYGAE